MPDITFVSPGFQMWKKDFIKYIIIITLDYDVSFTWRNICFFPITS